MKLRLEQIDLAAARGLSGADYLIQRKSDGCHALVSPPGFERFKFNAERMRDGSHRINDVLLDGLDTRARWAELQIMAPHFPPGFELEAVSHGGRSPGDFLDAELASGGEGIVLKPWPARFGSGWLKVKRHHNFLVVVTEDPGASQSVAVADATTREPRGRVALFGGKINQVQRGSVLKLTGLGLTARGLIREPRPDADAPDSWRVKF